MSEGEELLYNAYIICISVPLEAIHEGVEIIVKIVRSI